MELIRIGWKQGEPIDYMSRTVNLSQLEEICDKYRVSATVRGTFMILVIQTLRQRKKVREHYKADSDKLNDPDVLRGLITIINPDYKDPGKVVLKRKANDYKSCK